MLTQWHQYSLVEDPTVISVCTLAHAMRIATKYCMEKVQAAVAKVIQSKHFEEEDAQTSEAIAILLFIAEFPEHVSEDYVVEVFEEACNPDGHPSIEDMERLMAHPALVVAMMKYREGSLQPLDAVWRPERGGPATAELAREWLIAELKSLGLTK